jgi:hypothetical protein
MVDTIWKGLRCIALYKIKTPEREFPQTREERIQKTVFSPHATALRKLKTQICSSFENGAYVEGKLSCCSSQKLKDRGRAVSAKLIKEYSMLVRPLLLD